MRAKMAGAVVAACVGVCALAGGAKASPFYFSGSDEIGDGVEGVQAEYDIATKTGYFSGGRTYPAENGNPATDFSFYITVNRAYASLDAMFGYGVTLSGTGTFTDNITGLSQAFSTSFSFGGYYDPTAAFNIGNADVSLVGVVDEGLDLGAVGGFDYGGVFNVVPLPSSAPLLGLALVALGGIGYARRRMTRHAAKAS